MIKTLKSDTEWTLSKELLNLISVTNMVSGNYFVVTLMVVISIVMLTLRGALYFLATHANIINLWIVYDFLLLICSKMSP
jgi:hypothetical protein